MTHTATKPEVARLEQDIALLAGEYPEVAEENPWGHRAFKVKGKTFLFLSADEEGVSLSVKLPQTGDDVLALAFTEPTHYGLGRSGWVTAHLTAEHAAALDLVSNWLRESYVAIAPKKLSAALSSKPGSGVAEPVHAKKSRKAVASKPLPSTIAVSKSKTSKKSVSPTKPRKRPINTGSRSR